ncbi:MAG: dipicolinate synthase subunit B [Oscillospiraceae bacterium]|nr:dipicolinate synthase subunit B [Oscillospiraceae bacterium]
MTVGYAVCGSFCTHKKTLEILKKFADSQIDVTPVLSENSYRISTRFGKAGDFVRDIENITKQKIITSIEESEAIGPEQKFKIMIIAPCTGNTLAKLANGITDNCVTMAAKAHLRNQKPLVIGLCTNDALSSNLANIGVMMNKKNVFFVPMYQDDTDSKPSSLVCDMDLVMKTFEMALQRKQIQPVLFG